MSTKKETSAEETKEEKTEEKAEEKEEASFPRKYVVQRGDSLWSIAQEQYGNGYLWQKIYEANRGVMPNENALYAGIEITLPAA